MFKVQFSYQPDSRVPNGLPVAAGDEVIVVNRLSDNWLTAKAVKDGSVGLVPTAYVQEVTEPKHPFELYVTKHEYRSSEVDHLHLAKGAKVELLMKDSSKKWTVRDIESQQVGLVSSSNLVKSSTEHRPSPSAVEDALDGRFVFTKKAAAKEEKSKRKKNKQKGGEQKESKDDDCVSRDTVDSLPEDQKLKRSQTFSGRVFGGSGRGKKDISDKVAREELLMQIDETIAAMKMVGHKKGQPSAKEAISELTRVRRNVAKGRDYDVARCLLSGKPLPGKDKKGESSSQIAASQTAATSSSVACATPDGGQPASVTRTASVPADATGRSLRKGSVSVSRPSGAPPPPPPSTATSGQASSADKVGRPRTSTTPVAHPTRAPPVPVRMSSTSSVLTKPERAAPPPPPQTGTTTSAGQPSPQLPVPQSGTPNSAGCPSSQPQHSQAVTPSSVDHTLPQVTNEGTSQDNLTVAAEPPPKPQRASSEAPKSWQHGSRTPPAEEAHLQESNTTTAPQTNAGSAVSGKARSKERWK